METIGTPKTPTPNPNPYYPGPYPRQMADNSFAWAASKGLLRTNEVHKAEEAKLVIEEKFTNRTERGTSRTMAAEAEVEAPFPNNNRPRNSNPLH